MYTTPPGWVAVAVTVSAGFLVPASVERSQIWSPSETGNGLVERALPAASENAVTPSGTLPAATSPFVSTTNGPTMAFVTPFDGPVTVSVGAGGALSGPRS